MWDQHRQDLDQRGAGDRTYPASDPRVYGRAIDCAPRRARQDPPVVSGRGRGAADREMTDGHFPRG
jgi:hypothetical protein